VGCKLFTGIFTFHRSGAVTRFVITTSVNQNLPTNNKFQAANRFGKMTGYLINWYTLTFLKNKNVYAKVTRNCRWPETVEFTVPNMKALGLVVPVKKVFENCILKTFFWNRDLLMQPSGTVWTSLIEEHIGIIPVKFRQNPMSGFKREVVWMKRFTHARTPALTDDGLSQ